ncbi:37S ribosomal protein, mitochondrial [Cladochytrium tenue]|nr:37S ribosomal protein, mitochondrial [Cladochytrium tenue]
MPAQPRSVAVRAFACGARAAYSAAASAPSSATAPRKPSLPPLVATRADRAAAASAALDERPFLPANATRAPSAFASRSRLARLIPGGAPLYSSPLSPLAPPATVPAAARAGDVAGAFSLNTLMAAGMHLGHSAAAWNPHMLPYIYGERGGIHIINLEHTLVALRRAVAVVREVARAGGNVVFVGSRKPIHRITVAAAMRADAFYVTHWVKGTITNKERVLRRSVGFDPDKVTQDAVSAEDFGPGDADLSDAAAELDAGNTTTAAAPTRQPRVQLPDLLVLLDMKNNLAAVREACHARVPIVAICDTDCDPRLVQYPIPANDDSLASVELVAGLLSLACRRGRDLARRRLGSQQQSP